MALNILGPAFATIASNEVKIFLKNSARKLTSSEIGFDNLWYFSPLTSSLSYSDSACKSKTFNIFILYLFQLNQSSQKVNWCMNKVSLPYSLTRTCQVKQVRRALVSISRGLQI